MASLKRTNDRDLTSNEDTRSCSDEIAIVMKPSGINGLRRKLMFAKQRGMCKVHVQIIKSLLPSSHLQLHSGRSNLGELSWQNMRSKSGGGGKFQTSNRSNSTAAA